MGINMSATISKCKLYICIELSCDLYRITDLLHFEFNIFFLLFFDIHSLVHL